MNDMGRGLKLLTLYHFVNRVCLGRYQQKEQRAETRTRVKTGIFPCDPLKDQKNRKN
jgi:hypothetical protein